MTHRKNMRYGAMKIENKMKQHSEYKPTDVTMKKIGSLAEYSFKKTGKNVVDRKTLAEINFWLHDWEKEKQNENKNK